MTQFLYFELNRSVRFDLDPNLPHIKRNRTARFDLVNGGAIMMRDVADEGEKSVSSGPGRSAGRPAAGQDPAKREQILDGAKRCFMNLGFEAASMNEITSEAGVSKGTLYVYFEGKEDLFAELIDRERSKLIAIAQHNLEEGHSIADALQRFGVTLTTTLTSTEVIRAQRMVLGVAERMPTIAARFFSADPVSALIVLERFLDEKVASGDLVIADTELAASQFIQLATGSIFKRRLFGNLVDPVPAAEIERVVASGVDIFLAYYGARPANTPAMA
jgi:AcrR family transcriptional regulator